MTGTEKQIAYAEKLIKAAKYLAHSGDEISDSVLFVEDVQNNIDTITANAKENGMTVDEFIASVVDDENYLKMWKALTSDNAAEVIDILKPLVDWRSVYHNSNIVKFED